MKRLVLCLAMLLSLSSSLSGCSWIFVQPLPPRYERGDRTDCTTSRAAPVVDTILTLTNLVSAVYVAGQDNIGNKGPAVTTGLLVGALWFSSAIYGYSKTSECEAAIAYDEPAYTRPRMRLRSAPAVGYPAGVPGEPPPPRESPAVVVPPPPPPAPAARGSQQRDDDNPGAPARPAAPSAPQQADPE